MYSFLERLNPAVKFLGKITHNEHYKYIDMVLCKLRNPWAGFFTAGWGDINLVDKLYLELQNMKQETLEGQMPPKMDLHLSAPEIMDNDQVIIQDGQYKTISRFLEYLPMESEQGYIRVVKPLSWASNEPKYTPMVLLLPGTGEKRYGRRYDGVSIPLARMGIGSIIMEGPFYGQRKPKRQNGCKLLHVSDLPLLGAATIEEARSLLYYFMEAGYGPLVVGGISMGGLHAAMVAALTPFPVGTASLVGPPSAVPVFTSGLMADLIPWKRLDKDAHYYNLADRLKNRYFEVDKRKMDKAHELMGRFLSVTNIENFNPPFLPEAAYFATAKRDRYVPFELVEHRMQELNQSWKGSHVCWLEGSHVSSYLFERRAFAHMAKLSAERVQEYLEKHPECFKKTQQSLPSRN